MKFPGIGIFQDKVFFKTVLKLGVPVTLQCFFTAFLGLIDNIMVGQLGDTAVASVGLASQYFFILLLILIPVGGGIALFAAQFWGKQDISQIQKVTVLGLGVSLFFTLLFFLTAFLFPQFPMGWFSMDTAVIKLGSSYLQIACWGYLPVAINFSLAAALRSIHEVKLPLYASIIGVCLNTILNYLLIYGNFGFPRLGVPGSAIATVISQSLALIVFLILMIRKRPEFFRAIGEAFRIPGELVRRFFSQTGIMIAKDLVWALGISAYMMVYARISTDAAASMNITNTVRELAIVLFIGIATASHVTIGNKIGADKCGEAYSEARKYLNLTPVLGVLVGIGLIFGRSLLLMPYKVSEPVILGAMNIMLVYGLSFGLHACNQVFVMGVMRPGGDNVFCTIMDIIAVWGIGLPLAIMAGLFWKLPVEYVFALISIQEIFKTVLLLIRFRSKNWMHSMIHGI